MRPSKMLWLSLAIASSAIAQEQKVVGTIDVTLQPPKKSLNKTIETKQIKLLKIKLSPNELKVLQNRPNKIKKQLHSLANASNLPSKVELGMNNVPVLDQGKIGTCATFANTAAIDAALNQGDYISQVCQLQLGQYLERTSYHASGWDGSLNRMVLGQMEAFGIVNKAHQKSVGCGGLTQYPEVRPSSEDVMTPEQFHELSENLGEKAVFHSTILDIYNAFLNRTDTNKTLQDIKLALNEGDRVTFGVFLLDFDLGFAGAVGTHNAGFDSWVLTPEIARDIYIRPNFGGHAMVITGYDDDAVAIDEQGREHKGLLTLRNSWGEKYGDKGNFYMSYDYFKVLVMEVERIRNLPEDGDLDPDSLR